MTEKVQRPIGSPTRMGWIGWRAMLAGVDIGPALLSSIYERAIALQAGCRQNEERGGGAKISKKRFVSASPGRMACDSGSFYRVRTERASGCAFGDGRWDHSRREPGI